MRLRLTGAMIDDDTDRRVSLWSPWGHGRDVLPGLLRQRILVSLKGQTEGEQIAWGCGVALVLVFVMVVAGSFLGHLTAVPVAFAVLGLIALKRHFDLTRHVSCIRATLLAAHHCASCGYDLSGSTCDAAGCVRCPECAATWRLTGAANLPVGDQPQWIRGRFGRFLDETGFGFLLRQSSHSGLDDRGRSVEIVYPIPADRPPSQWHTLSEQEQRRIAGELRAVGRSFRVLFLLFVIFYASVTMPLWLSPAGGRPPTWFPLIWLSFFGPYALLQLRFPKVLNKRRYVDVVLPHLRCPSCIGDLSNCETEADGLTECPHCRAAWRVPAPKPVAERDPARTIIYAPPRD